ncbi:MAG: branched-chain amino acid aminotransferase [Desulfobacterales bacterium]|nr:branched-chain amino acid aminotransferase [Desulfobacterales bacterium]
MSIYYVDGAFVPSDQAVIPVDDLAVLRGFGVFDLVRTYSGKPFFLYEHIERLRNSAAEIGLHVPWTTPDLVRIVKETLAKNSHPESNIRIVVTGGSSPDFATPQDKPRLLVLVSPLPELPKTWYSDGVKIITWVTERFKPGVKSINYIPATVALGEARQKGAIEALYLDRQGYVLEGTTSNLFAFLGNTLITPGRDILSGITRQVVLAVAAEHFEVQIRDISRQELLGADEVFITGTNKGVVPVIQVDDTVIGGGTPGPLTQQLTDDLAQQTEKDIRV